MIKEHALLPLFQKFISDTKKGKRLNKNGSRVKPQTIVNYTYCYKLLNEFTSDKAFNLIIYEVKGNVKREHNTLKKYWGNFYKQFTSYMYSHKNCYDNYTGQNIKIIRTFFAWLNDSYNLPTGFYYKSFYVIKEDIAILTLTVAQLQFLLFDKAFEVSLSKPLQCTKDVLIVGCLVGLRYSDLRTLQQYNVDKRDGISYLKVKSKKTAIDTIIKLPGQALSIIEKYKKNIFLLPTVSLFRFNKNLKKIGELAGWTEPVKKTRNKNGLAKERNNADNSTARFCDLMSSHIMRRTCITTMLTSGMPEYIVRKISGHTNDSKAFFRYVSLAQSLMDTEIKKMHLHFEQPAK